MIVLLSKVDQAFVFADDNTRLLDERFTVNGRNDWLFDPIKDRDAAKFLHLLDLLTESGLRNVTGLCSFPEVAQISNSNDVFELSEGEHASLAYHSD